MAGLLPLDGHWNLKGGWLHDRCQCQLKYFRKAIKNLPDNRSDILRLGNSFLTSTKYDLAIETYEKGIKLLKTESGFTFLLADLYRRKGDNAQMIKYYLLHFYGVWNHEGQAGSSNCGTRTKLVYFLE